MATAVAAALLSCACGAAPFTAAERAADHQTAAALIAGFAAGRFGPAETAFSARMRTALPAAKLQSAWAAQVRADGPMVSQGAPTYREVGGDLVVDTPLHMQHGRMVARVTFDRSGAVVGLFFLRA